MRYSIFKYLLTGLVFVAVWIINTHPTYAVSPDFFGQVVNKFDNSGVAGVWVRWQDKNGSIRYAQTDADGKFYFRSWYGYHQTKQELEVNNKAECDNFIDTNLDKVKDSYQARTNHPNQGSDLCFRNAWGCVEAPVKWTVVLPAGWSGTFTDIADRDGINLLGFNNDVPPIDAGIIYWTPSCNCYGMDVDNIDNIAPGKTVTFTTKAKIENPDKNLGKVINMVYHVVRDGVEITPTPGQLREIPATGPEPATVGGRPVHLYTTNWSFRIPEEGSGIVRYDVWVKINCGATTAQIPAERVSLLKPLVNYINSLVYKSGVLQPKTVLSADQILLAEKSIKLGTFYPPEVGKGCDQMWFKINYDLK